MRASCAGMQAKATVFRVIGIPHGSLDDPFPEELGPAVAPFGVMAEKLAQAHNAR